MAKGRDLWIVRAKIMDQINKLKDSVEMQAKYLNSQNLSIFYLLTGVCEFPWLQFWANDVGCHTCAYFRKHILAGVHDLIQLIGFVHKKIDSYRNLEQEPGWCIPSSLVLIRI